MGVEGIGASVVRKEDRRFITGKGRYVDDIKLQGMTHAHFIRSPHAHAKVKGIDSSAAMEMDMGDLAVVADRPLAGTVLGMDRPRRDDESRLGRGDFRCRERPGRRGQCGAESYGLVSLL